MKKLFFALAVLFLAVSCQKDDMNMIYYPGVNTNDIPEGSVFDGVYLSHPLYVSGSMSNEFQEPFAVLNAQAKGTDYCGRVYYGSMDDDADQVLKALKDDEAVVIIEPNVDVIQPWLNENGYDIDLSSVRGNVLLAYTGRGEFYIINCWLKDDVLGSLNGLSTWLNVREQAKKERKQAAKDESHEVESIFKDGAFESGYTWNFSKKNYEVAHIACSDADYLSGKGNLCVNYKVYPIHAFGDDGEACDYYYVKMLSQVNSQGMYTRTTKCWHGAVWIHKQGFWLKDFGFTTTLLENGQPVGEFPVAGWPQPATTQGSTSYSYTSGLTWNIGADVSGGASKKDGGEFSASISGGVSVTNSTTETREVKDIAILNSSTQNAAKFTFTMMNLPKESNIRDWDERPNNMAIGGCVMNEGFIFKVPNVNDGSNRTFSLRVDIDKLLYQCHKDQSSDINYKLYNVDLSNQDSIKMPFIVPLPQPNRIRTGRVVINHDERTLGNYMFETTATDQQGHSYTLNPTSSIPCDGMVEASIPVGTYVFTTRLGNNASTAVVYESHPVTIDLGQTTTLHTGADYSTPSKSVKARRR